jgi:hypothetical protein
MLSRRELIAGGAVMTQPRAGDAVAAQRRSNEDYSDELRSIRDALMSLQNQVSTPTVDQIRERQRGFWRLNQHFPECIDVGISVWERMQDWHIANNRALTIQRAGNGYWQMDFIMTVLVLKPELPENTVGQAYDH